MSILVEFSVVPLGQGTSISPLVAKALKVVMEGGVPYKANPMGTVLEGEWEEVMAVVRKCHEAVMNESERVITTITIDDRKGKTDRLTKKLESVEQKIGRKLNQ